jgi:hypothetical protein
MILDHDSSCSRCVYPCYVCKIWACHSDICVDSAPWVSDFHCIAVMQSHWNIRATHPIQHQAPKGWKPCAFISCVILSFFLLGVPLYLHAKLTLEIVSTCVTCCIMFSHCTKNAIACVFSDVIEYLMILQQKQKSWHMHSSVCHTLCQ